MYLLVCSGGAANPNPIPRNRGEEENDSTTPASEGESVKLGKRQWDGNGMGGDRWEMYMKEREDNAS